MPDEKMSSSISIDTTAAKANIADLNRAIRVLDSGFKASAAALGDWTRTTEGNEAKIKSLNAVMDLQRQKIANLSGQYEKIAAEQGASSKAAQDLEIRINREREALGKNETAVRDCANRLNEMEAEAKGAATGVDNVGDQAAAATRETEKLSAGVSTLSDRMKNGLANAAKAAGAAMGAAAAAVGAAALKLGKEVIRQFGELEQNLGGSEAVFGEYAAAIQKTGEEAYRNLGVSQSEYLATANKMGALFQGSGIAQQKSLEMTEQAMQRAADMASVMGIDMSSALEAVTGAAKGNFTMMDNLGVAMNATTLQAYAASKGLNFVWNTATNAQKAELAMQMFFEQTEQYAGNFARESTQTVSGSIGLLKAAVSSFVAGLGNANANIGNLTANMADAFQAVVENITPILKNIVAALPTMVTAIVQAARELLPTLIDAFTGLLSKMLNLLLPVIMQLLHGLLDAIMRNLEPLINFAVQFVAKLADFLIQNAPRLLNAAVKLIMGIVDGLTQHLPDLIPVAIQMIVQLAVGLVRAIPQLVARLPEIVAAIVQGITAVNWPEVGWQLISGLVEGLKSALAGLWNSIVGVFSSMWDGIKSFFGIHSPSKLAADAGGQIMTGLVDGMQSAQPAAARQAQETFGNVWNAAQDGVGFGGGRSESAKAGAEVIRDLADGIENGQRAAVARAKSTAQAVLIVIRSTLGVSGSTSGIFIGIGKAISQGIANGITSGMASIRAAARQAAQSAVRAAKSELGIASPSRVAEDMIGAQWGAGVAKGIYGSIGRINSAIGMMSAGMQAATERQMTPAMAIAGASQGIDAVTVGREIARELAASGALNGIVYIDSAVAGRMVASTVAKVNGRAFTAQKRSGYRD
jgi:phage-related protein